MKAAAALKLINECAYLIPGPQTGRFKLVCWLESLSGEWKDLSKKRMLHILEQLKKQGSSL